MDHVGLVKRIKNGQYLVRILFVRIIRKRSITRYLLGGNKRPRARMVRVYCRKMYWIRLVKSLGELIFVDNRIRRTGRTLHDARTPFAQPLVKNVIYKLSFKERTAIGQPDGFAFGFDQRIPFPARSAIKSLLHAQNFAYYTTSRPERGFFRKNRTVCDAAHTNISA